MEQPNESQQKKDSEDPPKSEKKLPQKKEQFLISSYSIHFLSMTLSLLTQKAQTFAIRHTVHHKPPSNMGNLRPFGLQSQ